MYIFRDTFSAKVLNGNLEWVSAEEVKTGAFAVSSCFQLAQTVSHWFIGDGVNATPCTEKTAAAKYLVTPGFFCILEEGRDVYPACLFREPGRDERPVFRHLISNGLNGVEDQFGKSDEFSKDPAFRMTALTLFPNMGKNPESPRKARAGSPSASPIRNNRPQTAFIDELGVHLEALRETAEHVDDLVSQYSRQYMELCQLQEDLLHVLEFADLNAPALTRTAARLKQTGLDRREAKDMLEILTSLKGMLGLPALEFFPKACETVAKFGKRAYTPRQLTQDDLRELIGDGALSKISVEEPLNMEQ